jgi:hypothetical protein
LGGSHFPAEFQAFHNHHGVKLGEEVMFIIPENGVSLAGEGERAGEVDDLLAQARDLSAALLLLHLLLEGLQVASS